jgi:hypothetical protein
MLDLLACRDVERLRCQPFAGIAAELRPAEHRVDVATTRNIGRHLRDVAFGVDLLVERLRVSAAVRILVRRQPPASDAVPRGPLAPTVRRASEPLVTHVRHDRDATCSFALRLLRQSKRSRSDEKR